MKFLGLTLTAPEKLFAEKSATAGKLDETLRIGAFTVKVIRRSGLKNMTLRSQGPAEFRVTCPHRLAQRHLLSFLESRQEWMATQAQKYAGQQNWLDRHGGVGEKYWYLGELLTLKDGITFHKKPLVDFQTPTLWYLWPEIKFKNRDQGHSRVSVMRDLKEQFHERSEKLIRERVEHYAPLLGVKPTRVRFRTQKSRWGSCSSRGTVTFNLKLIGAPLDVIDSVVVHELSHLVHLNHSTHFWQLVAQFAPHHKEADRWLNEHQIELLG